MSYNTLLVEQRDRVLLVTLNRPEALNALNSQLLSELLDVMAAFDRDPGLGCAVITGSAKAFAAGADIKEMSAQGFADMYGQDFFAGWDRFTRTLTDGVELPEDVEQSLRALAADCGLTMPELF